MAAPATTTRQTPGGAWLGDGFRTLIAPAYDPDVSFWEKTVKPPGVDGGDKVDTTTMHNLTYRTGASRALATLTASQMKAAYDPAVYTQIIALVNRETSWTVRFPDNSTLDFYGFLRSFEPDELVEGQQPEASILIEPTNYDPTNKVEAGPVMTSVSGT